MATLVKANNATALNLAGSWSPAQVPTAADDLVFNTTYNILTASTLQFGSSLAANALYLGPVTGATGTLTLSNTATQTLTLTTPTINLTGANLSYQLLPSVGSPTFNLSTVLTLGGITLSINPADSNTNITFPLITGGASTFRPLPPNTSPFVTNIQFPGISATPTVIGPLVDAMVSVEGYNLSTPPLNGSGSVIVQGHPTLPTAITFQSTQITSVSTVFGQGFNSSVNAINSDAYGNYYFGGGFSTVGSGISWSFLLAYQASTQRINPMPVPSSTVNVVAKDATGNMYFGGIGNFGANIRAFAKYIPTTRQLTPLKTINDFATGSVNAIAIDATGKVYVGGSFASVDNSTVPAINIAVYDPGTNTWSALGIGAANTVYAIAISNSGDVYVGAGGSVGGTGAYLARWNPGTSTWNAITNAPITIVRALAYNSTANRLYVGTLSLSTCVGEVNIATNTYTAFAAPAVNAYSYALAYDSVNNLLYAGIDVSNYFAVYNLTTSTWSFLPGILSGSNPLSVHLDSAGDVWWGLTGTASFSGVALANAAARFRPSTSTWSTVSFATNSYSSSPQSEFWLWPTTNGAGIPAIQHGGGVATYVIAPGSSVLVNYIQTVSTTSSGIMCVRRGGNLLEHPALTSQNGTIISQVQEIPSDLNGPVNYVVLAQPNSNLAPFIRSSATEFRAQSVSFTDSQYQFTRSNASSTTYLVKAASNWAYRIMGRLDGNLYASAPWYSTDSTSFPFLLGGFSYPYVSTSSFSSRLAQPPAFGSPRTPGPLTISRTMFLGGQYMKFTNLVSSDPGKTPFNFPLFLGTTGAARVIEWANAGDVLIQGAGLIDIRVTTFSNFSILSSSKYVYTAAAPVTIDKPIYPFQATPSNIIVADYNSGTITVNTRYHPSTSLTGCTQEVSIYNSSASNTFIGDIDGVRRTTNSTMNLLRVGGPGTLTLIRRLGGQLVVCGRGTAVVDFSDPGAPLTDFLYPYLASDIARTTGFSGSGTLVFRGRPGAVNSQFLVGAIGHNSSGTYGDGYFRLELNGATSLTINAFVIYSGNGTLYFSGINAPTANISLRGSSFSLNGLVASATNTSRADAILTGALGYGDFIAFASPSATLSPVNSVTAFPTSGGATSINYLLSGSQTQVGNTSASSIRVITTTAADVLNSTGFNLTVNNILLTGNSGGTYTLTGTYGAALGLSNYLISNVSNSELRIDIPLTIASGFFVLLSGPGTISLGTPTRTYQANSGYTTSYQLQASECRIYAGSDNLTPFFGTGNIFVGAVLRLLGTGTGRFISNPITLTQNSILQIDENWTLNSILFATNGTVGGEQRSQVFVAATKTLTVNYWESASYSTTTSPSLPSTSWTQNRKTGPGTIIYKALPISGAPTPLWRLEEGFAEFNLTSDTVYGRVVSPMPIEILAGISLRYNSTVDHFAPFVTYGAGSVVKDNINTIKVRAYNSFTGGLVINAGEWNAQFANAVGDGNVTLNGGTLRASAVDEDIYVLRIEGNLIFAGGVLAIGDAYVA